MADYTTFDVIFPLSVLFLVAVAVPFGMMFANWLLAPQVHKDNQVKGDAYECGLAHVIGTPAERFPVKFYLVAMLFLVFDLEVAFLYPWAVQFLKGGWDMLGVLLVFLVILEAGYLYLIKKGALDWNKISEAND
jgi:NADH-quinone oxidoreductase subunit A